MTTELQFPDSRHNHPPRCCCDDTAELGGTGPCPACPDHGELAQGIECPQCHQPIGRPHTEFCTLAPGKIWDGVLPAACAYPAAAPDDCGQGDCPKHGQPVYTPPCSSPRTNHGDGRGCQNETCPRHGDPDGSAPSLIDQVLRDQHQQMLGQTSQPATRTSQAHTEARADRPPQQWLHFEGQPHRIDHRVLGGPWHEIERCAPGYCGSTPAEGREDHR